MELRAYFKNEKVFYRTFLTIAIPVAMQNFISSFLNTVDTIMIGRLGEIPLTGVSLANQIFFIFSFFIFGIVAATTVYTAQFWGKRDMEGLHKVFIIGISTSFFIFFGILFSRSVFHRICSANLYQQSGSRVLCNKKRGVICRVFYSLICPFP